MHPIRALALLKMALLAALFGCAAAASAPLFAQGASAPRPGDSGSPAVTLATMRSVVLPHTFTAAEMDLIRKRLQGLSLQLQLFAVAAPFLKDSPANAASSRDEDDRQRVYAEQAWPLIACAIRNGLK